MAKKLIKNKFEVIKRFKIFFKTFRNLGVGLLFVAIAFSLMFFWIFIGIYYGNKFLELSALMLKLTEFSIQIIGSGILGYYFCIFLNDILIKRGMKKHGKIKRKTK